MSKPLSKRLARTLGIGAVSLAVVISATAAFADSSIGTNIATSAGGTITSNGLLTGQAGLSVTGQTTLVGGTLTGASTPFITATQTWNNAATTFTGVLVNATDTASNANSLLMDLQVGGATRFNVNKNGLATLAGGLTVTTGGAAITGASSVGGTFTVNASSANAFQVQAGGTSLFNFDTTPVTPVNGMTFQAKATGGSPVLAAAGSDPNIGLVLTPKGTGQVSVSANGITVTGNSIVNGTLGGLTGLTVNSGGLLVSAGGITVNGTTNATGNVLVTGGVGVTGAADIVQLVVKGNATQTSNIFAVQTSAAANLLTVANSGATTIASGGLTVTAGGAAITGTTTLTGGLKQTGGRTTVNLGAPNTLGTIAATVADLLDNRIIIHSAAANDTITTPTAAALITTGSPLPGVAAVGDTFSFTVVNSAGANTVAVAGGTGVTMVGQAAVAIAANTTKTFTCRATNVTAAAEAISCY